MKLASCKPPRSPALPAGLEPLPPDRGIVHDARVAGALIAGADWSGVAARGAGIFESRLEDVALGGADLAALALREVELSRCDGANLYARGAALDRLVVEGCRLTGADLGEAALDDVVLRSCRVDLAALRFARLERVLFEACEMRSCVRGVERLRGVAMPWADVVRNAGAFASAVGVRVLDDDA